MSTVSRAAPRPAAKRPRGSIKLLTAKLALFAIVFFLTLLAGEVGVRMIGYEPIYSVYSRPSIFWKPDPLLGWTHEPGSTGTYIGPRPWPIEFNTSVEINSLGLRGPEIEPLPAGGRRVLFIGDSMLAAFEVEYEKTFVALIVKELTASLGVPVQTVNAGVRGYGTDQAYLYLRERGHALEPDAVVLLYSENDARNNITLHRMRRVLGKAALTLQQDGSLELIGYPVTDYPLCSQYRLTDEFEVERVDGVKDRLFCRMQMSLFNHSALFSVVTLGIQRHPDLLKTLYHLGSPNKKHKAPVILPDVSNVLTTAIMRELGAEVERLTGRRLLVISDDKNLRTLGQDSVADVVDIFSYQAVLGDDPAEVGFKNDGHFNELGHRRIAALVAPVIAERLRSEGGPSLNAPE